MSDDIMNSLEERTDDIDFAELIRDEMRKMLGNPSKSLIESFVSFHYSVARHTHLSPIFAVERWFASAQLCKKDFEKFASLNGDVKWRTKFCEFAYKVGNYYSTQQIEPLEEDPRRSMRFLYKTILCRLESDPDELARLKGAWSEGSKAFEAYVFT